ncbi:tetrapeptide repeat homeobox protein 2-like [Desmodus rotundus]|uniref:tetrapeptide repeat homeobox protein 2-like n=1 Tax=Desmodus rotundus TaxID=9430 RepID=UPI0039E5D278
MRIGPGTRSLLQVRVAPCSEWRVVKQVRREPPGARLRFSLPLRPPKRQRRQRSVYSVVQRDELERFFQNNHYPSYEERETLAARLNLQEQQVQVWFKNRRAKQTRLQGGTRTRQPGSKARASSLSPGEHRAAPAAVGPGLLDELVLPSPPWFTEDPVQPSGPGFVEDPVLSLGPGFAEDPVLPSGPGFTEDLESLWDLLFPEDPESSGSSMLPGGSGFHNPLGGIAAAESSASSPLQAWGAPAQDAQNPVPGAAAPAASPAPVPAPAEVPVSLEDSNDGDLWPDIDLLDLLSL